MPDSQKTPIGAKAPLAVLAIMRSEERVAAVRAAFAGLNASLNAKLRNGAGHAPAASGDAQAPDVLLLDMKLEELGALESLARTLKQTPPETAVLVTAPDATVDSVCRVLRLGVADFIPHPLTRENVAGVLQTLTAKRLGQGGEGRPRGRVITFLRSCGGAGATTLATQTGWELMQRSPRGKGSVCLVDLDLQFGNMAISLDLHGQFGLMQVLEGLTSLDGAFLRGAVSHHSSGLDLLAAPGRILALDALTRHSVDAVLDVARQEYDFAVVDLPHMWNDWTFEVVSKSDLLVLVAELSVTGVDRLRRELQLLADEDLAEAPLMIVANRFEKTWRYRERLSKAEAVLGRKIDCFVRYDRNADEARDKGVLLRDVRRGTNIEKDVRQLTELARKSLRAEPVLQAAAIHK